MKKLFLLLIVAIACVSVVSASEPHWTVTELLEDEVINGENDFGDLLFLGQTYMPQNYIKGTITLLELQQYDVMKWIGTQSIRVKNPQGQEMILTNGSDYYFQFDGNYTMTSMINASVFSIITSLPADDNNITISILSLPTGFDLDIPLTHFTLGDEQIVRFDLNIDDDVEFGEYDIEYKINQFEKTKQVEVLENVNWSMDVSNLSLSSNIKSGVGQYLGRIVLENEGNTDIEITITKSGDGATIISTPQPQTLYRKNNVFIDIQAQVPTVFESGVYDIYLNITGDITKEVHLNITVEDNIKPIIEEINFSTDKVHVVNDISVVATDNVDVVNLTMTFDNQVKKLSKDGNLFTTQVKFLKLSRYVINFCAYDDDGNEACSQVNRTFEKVPVILNASTIYNMPSMRYGKYSRVELFDIVERVPEGIVFSLVDLQTSEVGENQSLPIIRIVDEKGSIKQFPKYGEQITVFDTGKLFLEVRADKLMSVDAVLRVDMPDQYKEIGDLTFKVSFKDYDVPQPFSIAWVDGRDVTCTVTDTGNLDSSYYDCSLRYPISVQATDISIPTTVEERNKLKAEADDVREELNTVKRRSGWFITILITTLSGLLLFTLFFIYWYPYVRFKTGSKKNIKIKEREI